MGNKSLEQGIQGQSGHDSQVSQLQSSTAKGDGWWESTQGDPRPPILIPFWIVHGKAMLTLLSKANQLLACRQPAPQTDNQDGRHDGSSTVKPRSLDRHLVSHKPCIIHVSGCGWGKLKKSRYRSKTFMLVVITLLYAQVFIFTVSLVLISYFLLWKPGETSGLTDLTDSWLNTYNRGSSRKLVGGSGWECSWLSCTQGILFVSASGCVFIGFFNWAPIDYRKHRAESLKAVWRTEIYLIYMCANVTPRSNE